MKKTRVVVGTPIAVVGFFLLGMSGYKLTLPNPSIWALVISGGIGLLVFFVGGFIVAPVLTEELADKAIEHAEEIRAAVPVGHRRKTDPPPPPQPPATGGLG